MCSSFIGFNVIFLSLFKGMVEVILEPPKKLKGPDNLCLMGKATTNFVGLIKVSVINGVEVSGGGSYTV